jgi:hypothetical protein
MNFLSILESRSLYQYAQVKVVKSSQRRRISSLRNLRSEAALQFKTQSFIRER